MPDAVALPDANCATSTVFSPLSITGMSPEGSLAEFRYGYAGHLSGFCVDSYVINAMPRAEEPTCEGIPWLQLMIFAPFASTGTNQAQLTLANDETQTTNATFEATQLDPPDATAPRIAGHFVSHETAWSFDIPVDLTSTFSSGCI